MQEFIRLTQTDDVENPEMHEDKTDVTGLALNSIEVVAIKNSLAGKMVAANSKFQKHYHDHNDTDKHGCRLEDI